MPLHDAFKKRPAQKQPEPESRPQLIKMSAVPTVEDLRFSMMNAMRAMGQPIMLTWKRGEKLPTYLLSVTAAGDMVEPTWILHIGDDANAAVAWIYNTPDPDLIYNLLVEAVNEKAPAAVIPDNLRPGMTNQVAGQNIIEASKEQEPGSIFSENYEIVELIGSGGMGMIYKARNRFTNEFVALKLLHAHLLADQRSRKRFEQEANSAKKLNHRNLITVKEYGYSKFGQPFLVMDYVEGEALDKRMENVGPLDLQLFINIFTQICDGLAQAHEQGVIHRDLKPSNIMLFKTETGVDTVKIIDFGIAKISRAESGEHLTTTGDVLGSPAYMSPEQCGGTTLDARSDIYSLGCVMYEAVCGVLPFNHPNAIKTILMQVSDLPPPFATIRPDLQIPNELERIIFKALEKDPDMRYQTVGDLTLDLWSMTTGPSNNQLKAGQKDLFSVLKPAEKDTLDKPLFVLEAMQEDAAGAAAANPGSPASPQMTGVATKTALPAKKDQIINLFKLSGLVTDNDIEAATECAELMALGRISPEQAAVAIQMCHRTGKKFMEMAKQLGIRIE